MLELFSALIFLIKIDFFYKHPQPFPTENSFPRKSKKIAINKRMTIPPKRILSPILFSINLINCKVIESVLCTTRAGVPIKNRVCQVGDKGCDDSFSSSSLNFFLKSERNWRVEEFASCGFEPTLHKLFNYWLELLCTEKPGRSCFS